MAKSTTQRSLKHLRDEGWPNVQVVEVWIAPAKRHRDLFGFCDILALHPDWGHLYVQTTSGSHVNARLDKLREFPDVIEDVLLSGSRVEIHGWRKLKRDGRMVWKPRILNVGFEELFNVDKGDWPIILDFMAGICKDLPEEKISGIFKAKLFLCNYPPHIAIEISQTHAGIGNGSVSSCRFSKKELMEASEMAANICYDVLKKHDGLKVIRRPEAVTGKLLYSLRPKDYNKTLKELKDG